MHFNVEPVGHFIVLKRKSHLAMSTMLMDVQLRWVMLDLPIAPGSGRSSQDPEPLSPKGAQRRNRIPLHSLQGVEQGGSAQRPWLLRGAPEDSGHPCLSVLKGWEGSGREPGILTSPLYG